MQVLIALQWLTTQVLPALNIISKAAASINRNSSFSVPLPLPSFRLFMVYILWFVDELGLNPSQPCGSDVIQRNTMLAHSYTNCVLHGHKRILQHHHYFITFNREIS